MFVEITMKYIFKKHQHLMWRQVSEVGLKPDSNVSSLLRQSPAMRWSQPSHCLLPIVVKLFPFSGSGWLRVVRPHPLCVFGQKCTEATG